MQSSGRTPEKSDRQIARELGVSDKTVGVQRSELERAAEIPHVEFVTGADGKQYPRQTNVTEPEAETARVSPALSGSGILEGHRTTESKPHSLDKLPLYLLPFVWYHPV